MDERVEHGLYQTPSAAVSRFVERHPPIAVVRPENAKALERVIVELGAARVALWPLGAGTHAELPALSEGQTPRPYAIVDTRDMAAVAHVDVQSAMVQVGAGATLASLQAELLDHGLTVDHLGRYAQHATIGGLLGRVQGQSPAFGYPSLTGACVGLEAITAPHTTYGYRPAPRKASGPDLRGCFIGARGSAGVMTSVWLSVSHLPRARVGRVARLSSLALGVDVMRAVLAGGVRPWSAVLFRRSGVVSLHVVVAGEQAFTDASVATLERTLAEHGVVDVTSSDDHEPYPSTVVWESQGDLVAMRAAASAFDEAAGDLDIDAWTPFGARLLVAGEPGEGVVALPWDMTFPPEAAPQAPSVVATLSAELGAVHWLSAAWHAVA